MPVTETERVPRPADAQRDDELIHCWFEFEPHRTLCGLPRRLEGPYAPYAEVGPQGDDCLVCEDLARAYIHGRWVP